MEAKFTFGIALKIIFKYIQAPSSVLAERYVDRDRTLVYKWLRGTAFPPKKLFPDIIRFVTENANEPVRRLIRSEMDQCLSEAGLSEKLKELTGEKSDIADYLESVFSLLTAEKALQKDRIQPEASEPPEAQNLPGPSLVLMSAERAVHIRLTASSMVNIGLALLAAISGEILWLIIAYAIGWPYAPEIPYGAVSVLPAFFRGILILPAIVFVMLRKEYPSIKALSKTQKLTYIGCYALAGGIGGLLLAGPGLETLVGGFLPAPIPQAAFLIFIHALVLSFLPMLSLLALLRFPRINPGAFLFLEFGPALLCALTALPVLLSGQLPLGRVWLGGFFPGVALILLMSASVRIVFRGYPGTIKLAFSEIPQE